MNQEEQENLNKQLIGSSKNGQVELIKNLIQKGADIHAKDDSALRWAAYRSNLDLIKYFLFDCQMEVKQETKDWLIEKHLTNILELIQKRDFIMKNFKKLNQDIIQKDLIDNLKKKIKI